MATTSTKGKSKKPKEKKDKDKRAVKQGATSSLRTTPVKPPKGTKKPAKGAAVTPASASATGPTTKQRTGSRSNTKKNNAVPTGLNSTEGGMLQNNFYSSECLMRCV